MRKLNIFLIVVFAVFACVMCAGCVSEPVIDYPNAEALELAINAGVDVKGKTVTFVVQEFRPNSAFGYNLISGEHLNFCSSEHPEVNVGDTVTVKITEVVNVLGSYVITYKKI